MEKLRLPLSGNLAVDSTKSCTIINNIKAKACHQLWCLGHMGTTAILVCPDRVTATSTIQEQRAQKILKGWRTCTLESTDTENNQRSMKGPYHDGITNEHTLLEWYHGQKSNAILWAEFRLRRLKITGTAVPDQRKSLTTDWSAQSRGSQTVTNLSRQCDLTTRTQTSYNST